jgi:hypothetical protein
MLPHIRRAIIVVVCLVLVIGTLLLVRYHFALVYLPSIPADATTVALYVLTTIAQALAALLGMAIAIIFISAQFGPHSQLVRSGIEILKDRTGLGILAFFVAAIITSLISLARVQAIVGGSTPWVLDFNVLLSVAAVALVVPLVLVQIENLNPFFLAEKLSQTITLERIARYGLVKADRPAASSLPDYRLHVWGHQHGRDDPLGAFHEIVMMAVAKRDRLQLAAFMRLLLKRIARVCGARLPLTPTYPALLPRRPRWRADLVRLFRRPLSVPGRIRVTLHILHYYIRRCQNLRREWGHLDGVRQQYLLSLSDLLDVLAQEPANDACIRACLFAALHISLGYADVPRYGEDEALLRYGAIASALTASGYDAAAHDCASIVGFVAAKTVHLPPPLAETFRAMLPDHHRTAFDVGKQLTVEGWRDGVGVGDPWKARLETYKPTELPSAAASTRQ